MIIVDNVSKRYITRKGYKTVLNNVSFTLQRGEKLGILGRNGAGKSTLIRLISEIEKPTSGTIKRSMTISWPLAFSGAFQGSLTGMDNLRFICRIYQNDIKKAKEYVEDFAELGEYLYEPLKKYSSGMRARLAFALSLSIEFDCYLIDEVIAVGDSRFTQKCKKELFENKKDRSLILVSHNMKAIKSYCDKAMVLDEGNLYQFQTIDEAYNYHNNQQKLT
ncbi:ABC transporter ATP-binding protein [Gilliamella apicola]|uniref:ATP-binding protein n=1 Tax=Gilliamella apicola TaxID=1196095 RepID=X2H4L4_9GAMM|nr:ABC transporter ATP-binding protein [Gilliamella apicola]AHN26018.1 Capsular polysaccharide ABC transporter, ATP-binding protein KpsT [Gilliamella apicola]OTP81001.1 ATP-binding protein [Gilliamella apicola]OTP83881.1 ATP-binding protein [Gilliamella apicola]OTP86807.1 ATP-binding protein [Gilliamella apicola]OTP98822.1 ATP-binding protein [Gilliamella apicola]